MTLLDTYQARINNGELISDPAQAKAARALSDFVTAFDVIHKPKRTLFKKKPTKTAMRGLYVWGGVGRGKTMLMDMLVASIKNKKVRRVHFHAFMLEVHARLKSIGNIENPLTILASDIANDIDLLCFDELHVNDIADAMILGPLFEALDKTGVTLILTSNYAPDDLYKNGLQRARFLPFIEHIKSHMDIIEVDSPTDYRLRALTDNGTWFMPLSDQSWGAMDNLFETLTNHETAHATSINIGGRELPIQRAAGHIAWCDFKTLCVENRGASDYIALGTAFDIIFIDNIRHMDEHHRNEARRFMTLIDTLYDMKRVVIIRAACQPADTYSGSTHKFEYDRTLSRLIEMQSPDWFSTHLQGNMTT